LLRGLRDTDPDKGRKLVATTIETDPADQRTAYVKAFATGLSMNDEPFLESALDDRSKEVRAAAAELLRALPDSRLALRMLERASALLSWKPTLLGLGKGRLEVETPASCDKAMLRDGVKPKPNPRSQLGERAWLLCEILSATPPKSLVTLLGVSAGRIVEGSQANEWYEALSLGWTDAAIRLRDTEWAEALLEAAPWTADPAGRLDHRKQELFTILPPERREDVFLKLLKADAGPLHPNHPAFGLVNSLGDAMTLTLAREIIAQTRRLIDDERAEFANPEHQAATTGSTSGGVHGDRFHQHAIFSFIQGLAYHLPLEITDEAAQGFPSGDSPRLHYESAYIAMIERLKFRRDMHREFAV
jgi:hypothetical protein